MQAHDIICVSNLTKQGISSKATELYESGASLRTIAAELRLAKTIVRNHLVNAGVALQTHSNDQLKSRAVPRKPSIKAAPYGYCLAGGRILPDPKEQITLQLILKWWQQGMSHCAIAKTLNEKNIKPRKASKWSQPTVGFIIKRQQP